VLKGSSAVWNQLAKIKTYNIVEQEVNGIKMTIEGDYLVFNGTATDAAVFDLFHISKVVSNHKYLFNVSTNYVDGTWEKYCFYMPNDIWKSLNLTGRPFIGEAAITKDNLTILFTVWKGVTVSNIRINKNFGLIDLTQMFGADIANTITKPEQFYEMLPEGVDINAYNTGEIVDASYKAIKTTGFNQWDEQWRTGEYDSTTGEYIFNQASMANTNPIRVVSGCDYYVKLPASTAMVVFMYDYNMTYIGTTTIYSTLSIPANVSYINFRLQSSYGLTYKNDICINIAWDEYSSLNGTYKPYKPFERDLSWVAKYFPNGMRSAGNVADEIRFNSTTQQWEVVQRVGVVDLGSLNWTTSSTITDGVLNFTARSDSNDTILSMKGVSSNETANITCSRLVTASGNDVYTRTVINGIACNKSTSLQYLGVASSAYTTNAQLQDFVQSMQGVLLNYELATPIVTPITEDVNLAYDVTDYGTEQLIVAEGAQSAPLSAEVVYEPNVLASIKQVATMLTRLDALETAVATMQASAVATTNEE
jgi:hypothetical protein